MKRLYTPFKVNKLELKNRVIMSPMSIGHTVDGFIMDDVVEFYKRRAQGGVGLIIFANMQWDKLRYNPNHGAMLTDEKYIPSLKKLTDAIHEGGSKVFAQLMHRGRCANRASIQGEQAVAPSPIPGRFTHFEMPKELTVEEIKEFVDWQAEAAVIAKKAGFDGIEIETNSGYLYGQFFSPLTNHRTDEYGGSLETRCRFMVETLEGMRAAVGPDYPISLRVSGSDFMDGGCNGDDIAEICELLDKTGYVDGFSITAGWHESAVPLITMEVPHGAWAYLGRQIKARVKAPVAQGMRMNIEKAEELVDRGDFDAIVMGRPFLADPDVVNKAEAGKASTIRPCVGCNAKCLDMAMVSKPIGCIGNYECNREEELEDENGLMPTEKKSEHPEKILVIGAGPSGMEFARVAALRGHKVTIWEKRNRTIGLSLYAATPPRRYDIRYFGQWLERTCRELGVEIILNKEATAEDIIAASKDYDRVVLACGSKASIPPIPRDPSVPIVHAWDVFEGTAELGKNVVVVGGGDVGVEVAMYIGEIGTLTADELRFMMIYKTEPYIGAIKDYPIKSLNASLSELLAGNEERLHESKTFGLNKELVLNQSFRTAYEHFAAIYQKTKAVIVPYGEGSKLIADLCGEHDMQNEMRLLRLAQSFSVNLFDAAFNRLARDGAIYAVLCSFAGADFCSGKAKFAENTCCIVKSFNAAWAEICPSKPICVRLSSAYLTE